MKLNHLFVSVCAIFLLFSCSKEGSEPVKTNPIVINSIESSKPYAFIEDTVILDIDATGYANIDVTSTNNSTVINKVNNTTYEINATEATNTVVKVTLSSEDFTEERTLDLSFYEHGVINHKVVEGIKIDVDSPEKVRTLLGEPEAKTIDEEDNEEVWYYFERGMWILMDMDVNQVHYIRLYGFDFWTRRIDNVDYVGDYYPYEIGEGLKISKLQLTMDTVISKFGLPTEKFNTTTPGSALRIYDYEDIETLFYFNSDSLDNYYGKTVGYINVY